MYPPRGSRLSAGTTFHFRSRDRGEMRGRRRCRELRLEPLEQRWVLDSTVVFNEIMYNPAGNTDDTLEWIELYNQLAVNMDVSDWSIEGGIEYTFPDGTVVPGRGFVVVAISPSALEDATGYGDALGPYTGQLSNGGEELRLVNNSGRVMNVVEYGDGGDWPVGPDGAGRILGVSLAKLDPRSASEPAENWTFSAETGGTPGAVNFPASEDDLFRELLPTGAEGRALVPPDGTLGLTWIEPEFNDSGWMGATGPAVTTGVGYNRGSSGFDATFYKATGTVSNLTTADTVISNPAYQSYTASETAYVVNYLNTNEWGHYSEPNPFPGTTIGVDVNDFVLRATGTVIIPQTGNWTFGINSDDGARLRVDGTNLINDDSQHGPQDHFGTRYLSAGQHTLDLVFFERGGGAEVELFAAQGTYGSFDPGAFALVGDADGGGLAMTGFGGAIQTDVEAEMYGQNSSIYLRLPFVVADPGGLEELQLRMKYNDGFVAYLNGQEVASDNDPGSPQWNSAATDQRSFQESQVFEVIDVSDRLDVLVPGENVLAVHGLNHTAADDEFLILPELVGYLRQQVRSDLVLNEVAPASEPDFWVEIANLGEQVVDLEEFVLEATGASGGEYAFPAQTISPGEFLVVEPGFQPDDEAKLFLYTPGKGTLVDARVVKNSLRGRSEEHGGQWLYPQVATPGAENTYDSFDFHDEIVINEIMYHAFPTLATPGIPPTYDTVTLLDIDATTMWRYNDTGSNLGSGWAQTTHPVDNVNWFQGPALIGYETSGLPEPLRTWVNYPRDNVPYIITYYFETEFEFSGDLDDVELQLRHVIDDGAIFYLNGVEVLPRFNMFGGTVSAATLASSTVGEAAYVGPTTISADSLVVGTNVFSVEVHQGGTNSSDIVFGVELLAAVPVDPGTPGTPFEESPEEWIELYNRGPATVDLSGWKLEDAIEYEFTSGTTIDSGDYLVVAKDVDLLRDKYPDPGIDIVGGFSGSLNNADDRILLVDANKNPADEVHYYERGSWPEYADGGGSTLELRNPDADNSKGEAWAASDESEKSTWNTYSVSKVSYEPLEVGTVYNEFIFGLLDAGEFLIDDVSVKLDGTTEMIQKGTFEEYSIGPLPDTTWRLIGTHSGQIVDDPDAPGNKVLHVVASDPQQHVHDHVETTFTGNTSIQDGHSYDISFRAKWLGGNSQINNRLYFTRMGNTIQLDVPELNGTPGAVNSSYKVNVGPTYSGFGHSPVLPAANEPVTVSVEAEDPDGVSSVTLRWNINGGTWNSVAMTAGSDGVYRRTIAGQSSGTVVQFYVEGQDGLGATSTFPAAGPDSRALFQFGSDSTRPIDTVRLVLLSADNNSLFSSVNMFSNKYVGTTVIYDGEEAFYDVEVRQVGSRFVRPNSGYKVRLNPDHKLYGVHSSFRIDRSGGGPAEIYMKQMVNRAGGSSVSLYDDIAYVISPRYTGTILLQLARYEDLFLNEQFDNGGDGTKYELDDITFPTDPQPYPEGLKTGTGVSSPDMNDRGEDPEAYRGQLLIKNNRARDDYSKIVEMSQAIHLSGDALYEATQEVMDVDLWMRHYATQAFLGNWDTYGFGRPKNLRIYVRPEDEKVIPLYWDADLANLTENLIWNGGVSRLDDIRNLPQNYRLFLGHLQDLTNRSFNREYIESWITHYDSLGAGIGGGKAAQIEYRVSGTDPNKCVDALIERDAPFVTFQITTNGGNPFSVNDVGTTLEGNGWINVREIWLAGSDQPLEVTWTTSDPLIKVADRWQVKVPLAPGENQLTFEARDFQGALVGSDTITITSTVPERPLEAFLRITEIMYNPAEPTAGEKAAGYTDKDEFEFLELTNISSVATIDLDGVTISGGIDELTLADVTLAPGERTVVVANLPAFEFRYGTGINVAGEYGRKLGNDGEQIRVEDPFGQPLFDFEYNKGDDADWPGRADGKGASLELNDPGALPGGQSERTLYLEDDDNWHSSVAYLGTPGAEPLPATGIVINEVLTHSDPPDVDAIELYNTTDGEVDVGGWCLSDSWGWGSPDPEDDYKKFWIPEGTTIGAHQYLVFYEGHYVGEEMQFAENEFGGAWPKGFGLNGGRGDDVWLMEADPDGNLTRFADHVDFMAAAPGESFGRWPNGCGDLYPMITATLHRDHPEIRENSGPRVGPVVISEVHYFPDVPEGADQLEFIEIYNPTDETVDLTDWRIRQGIDFDFGDGTLLAAHSALVVLPFDPEDDANYTQWSAFCTEYGLNEEETDGFVGGYSDILDNGGEKVQLQHPDDPIWDPNYFVPHFLEDEVRYDDEDPWPTDPDGWGESLNRLWADAWGNESSNWTAADPSPGTATLAPAREVKLRQVFYNNSAFDGNNPAADELDDDAIATDKEALPPDQTANGDNYTGYSRGINGIMVDIAGLANPDDLNIGNLGHYFEFHVGNSDDPAGWGLAPAPSGVALRESPDFPSAKRVTLVWPDYAIRNQWLQVTVLADAAYTGLTDPDVFYFGNAVGESGNSELDAEVNDTDVALACDNPRNFFNPAVVTCAYDYNRDARVNATDMLIAGSNPTDSETALKLIHPPALEGVAAAAGIEELSAHDALFEQAVAREPSSRPTSLGTLAWLYEYEQISAGTSPSKKVGSAGAAVDKLLATYLL